MKHRSDLSGTKALYKPIIVRILAGAFMLGLSTPAVVNAQDKMQGRITLSGAWALYPMAVKWAEEFRKLHPLVRIDISAGGAGKGMTDVISGLVDIGMVSREIYPAETKKGALSFAMVRDAVVPVVNASNPAINDILLKGLKRDAATNLWITGKCKSWSQVLATKIKAPVHVYTRSDACGAAETWARYFGRKQEDLLGSGVYGDPGLALAVKKDPVGIGYNNIGYAYDHTTRKPVSGLKVIPLDLNGDGKIDPDENFYDTLDEIVEAISRGRYPSPPARDLYFVTKGRPQNRIASEFIRWALTEGQKFVNEAGYIKLSKEKISGETGKL
jgi:phosphate transport system substrate-binding protein